MYVWTVMIKVDDIPYDEYTACKRTELSLRWNTSPRSWHSPGISASEGTFWRLVIWTLLLCKTRSSADVTQRRMVVTDVSGQSRPETSVTTILCILLRLHDPWTWIHRLPRNNGNYNSAHFFGLHDPSTGYPETTVTTILRILFRLRDPWIWIHTSSRNVGYYHSTHSCLSAWPMNTGFTGYPETKVTTTSSRCVNIPNERRSHLHRGASLKPTRTLLYLAVNEWLLLL